MEDIKKAIRLPIIRAFHPREDPSLTKSFSRRSKSEFLKDFLEKDTPKSKEKSKPRLPRNIVFLPSFQTSPSKKLEGKINFESTEISIRRNLSEDVKEKYTVGRPPFDFLKNIEKIKLILQQNSSLKALSTQNSEKPFIPFRKQTSREKLETPTENLDHQRIEHEPVIVSETPKPGFKSIEAFVTNCNIDYVDRLISYDKYRSNHSLSVSFSKRDLKKHPVQDTLLPRKAIGEEDNKKEGILNL